MSRQQRRYEARNARRQRRSPGARFEMRLEISPEDAATFPEDESAWTEDDHRRFAAFVRFRKNDGEDSEWHPLPAT